MCCVGGLFQGECMVLTDVRYHTIVKCVFLPLYSSCAGQEKGRHYGAPPETFDEGLRGAGLH